MLASAHYDVGLDTHALEILDTGLRRLCLQFLRSTEVWDEGYMNKNCILMADFMLELTY